MTRQTFAALVLSTAFALSCTKGGAPDNSTGGNNDEIISEVTEVTEVTSSISMNISTDKSIYKPGETVTFTADNMPSGAKIRYRHNDETVLIQDASSATWQWTAPSEDFTGYLVDIFIESEKGELIYGTIAVDVSSDWTRFPRYGFVGDFDSSKLEEGVIEAEMDFLRRCHINGIQFYDWHNKHHWPLGGTMERIDEVYNDIANRPVYSEVLKKYIKVQHDYGMKCMFYNLCYGALDDAAADGVKEEWYIFKGANRTDKDFHGLPDSWKSNIFLLDPGNEQWQEYLAERNREVYTHFDFDGFHIDQLGYRGDRYDWNSNIVNFPKSYASFIKAMKNAHPDKTLVMNAVGSYGASQIAGTGCMGFLYNECWEYESEFKDLYNIVKANDSYSSNTLNTVFAAYMNYGCDNREFNIPGVLLTDAVMFAIGGSHLELGDHMLCREYFPYKGVTMSEALRTQIVRYYDFMTAYQNLLRGESTAAQISVDVAYTGSSKNVKIAQWPPQQGKITTFAKQTDGRQVIHMLNFLSAESLSWRDYNGDMVEPRLVNSIPVEIKTDKTIRKVWVASPDKHAGAPVELAFRQTAESVSFTVPSLKYWTMIVLE